MVSDGFIDSKRDRRLIKHSAFVSRITKASSRSRNRTSTTTTAQKRRRPSKKLVATLESLGDALDDIRRGMEEEDEDAAADADAEEQARRQGKVRHKSLRTRPGALKRKEWLVKGEMERFGRSLAQLADVAATTAAAAAAGRGSGSAGAPADQDMDTEMAPQGRKQEQVTQAQTQTQPSATSSRWAALRGFISATMEQNPAFLAKT